VVSTCYTEYVKSGPDADDTWARAAKAATFDYFELLDPSPDQRWAGGYGHGTPGTLELEVLHSVNGIEVSVRTSVHADWFPTDNGLRLALHGLLLEATMLDKGSLILPQTWSLDPDNRRILVDHEPVEFRGIRLNAMWAGVARIDDVEVTVSVRGNLAVHALTICRDWALPDGPLLD
jgi:hypothetical protein